MGRVKFIQSILAKCESMRPGVIAFAYQNGNATGTHKWIEVCVSDFDLYSQDQRFKTLRKAWYKVAEKQHIRLVFAFCSPKEKKLCELAESGNLLMNIQV